MRQYSVFQPDYVTCANPTNFNKSYHLEDKLSTVSIYDVKQGMTLSECSELDIQVIKFTNPLEDVLLVSKKSTN